MKNIYIIEGIASSGKTTIEKMLLEKIPDAVLVSEGKTLMPIIENKNPQVALEHLLNQVSVIRNEKATHIIIDRFHLTHAFRTGASLKDFALVEDELKKLGNIRIILLTMEADVIKSRIEEAVVFRKDQWLKGRQGSIEEKTAYYVDQQSTLLSLLKETCLQHTIIDTADKLWKKYVTTIVSL